MACPIVNCDVCGKSVRLHRMKNYGGRAVTVKCDRTPRQILLDREEGPQEYYYGGKIVRGREVSDGITAYPIHICRFK